MATYVNDLRLKEIATGDESGTWGTSTNTNLELIAEAFSFGTEAITTNADTHTTTIADGSTDPGRSLYLKYTGTLDSACTITIGPNTVSKLWFIENGTSGSQNIIISQGSGANITIPPGDVKAVYSDGAGSGAAVVDAFASLNVVDLKVQDDLTVTDDATVGGTLGVTGILTCTDDIIIGDGKTIGSASDVDAMTIASNGQVTFSQNIIGTLGTAAQTNITSLGTLTTLTVDDITINGSTISDSGDFTLDVGGDISLDADGGDIFLKDAGTTFGELTNSSTDFIIKSTTSNKDIVFKGNDGGSTITALTLDMSDAGKATFLNGFTSTGTSHSVGSGLGTDSASLEIGPNRTDSGNAFIDLIGDTTYTDYGARFIRASTGANTTTTILHRGTGALGIKTQDAGPIILSTTDTERARISAGGRFLIGHSSALTAASGQIPYLQVIGTTASTAGFSLNRFSANSSGSTLFFVKSRNGTPGSNTIVQSGDTIGSIDFKMDDGTNYQTQVARIMATMDGTPGENDAPGRLTFHTTADGAATVSERMRINSSGQVSIGTTTAEGGLLCLDTSGNNNRSIVIGRSATDDASKSSALSILHYNNGSEEPVCLVGAGIDDDTDNTVRIGGGFSNLNSATIIDFFTAANNDTTTGTRRMRIDSSGSVGIGTTSPAESLHTAGNIRLGDSAPAELYTNSSEFRLGVDRNNDNDTSNITFYANNSEKVRIDKDGNVGIGTTSPSTKLDVQGSGLINGDLALGAADSNNRTLTIAGASTGSDEGGEIRLATAADHDGTYDFYRIDAHQDDLRIGRAGTTDLTLNSSGNLGLGTTSPSRLLDIENSTASGSTLVSLVSATDGNVQLLMGDTSSDTQGKVLYDNSTDFMSLHANGSERLRIHSAGQVTIGTTSTTVDSSNVGILLNGGNGRIKNSVNVAGSGNVTQMFGTAGEFRIKGDGDAENTNNSYGALSDARLKENIVDATNKLDDINKVQVRNFNLIGSEDKQIGVVAQELESVFPSLVKTNDEGIKSVKYSVFVPILIKAVQEQQEQIESLKSEIANLAGE